MVDHYFEGASAQSTDADLHRRKKDLDPTETTRIVVAFSI